MSKSMNICDLHCDTLLELYSRPGSRLSDIEAHINLHKLKRGGSLLQCFAVFVPPSDMLSQYGIEISHWNYFKAAADIFDREMAAADGQIAALHSFRDISTNADKGISTAMLTLENGECIDGKLERIGELYRRGVRMIALTWNGENCLGYPHSPIETEHRRGLKDFGFEALTEMERLGIIVDVSHLSEGGFYDVAEAAKKPFLASHSCARSLCDHSRNLSDKQLKTLADHGGICGLNFYSKFLRNDSDFTRYDDILRHMEHIVNVAGIDCVALGSDFDGIECELEFGDFAGMPLLLERISDRFGGDNCDKIAKGNALRLLSETIR